MEIETEELRSVNHTALLEYKTMLDVLKETKNKIKHYEDEIFLLTKENQNIKHLNNKNLITQEERDDFFSNVLFFFIILFGIMFF